MHDIELDLQRAEQALYDIQGQYPGAAVAAATCRYIYDQAWAQAWKDELDKVKESGEKKPTDPTLDALVTLRCSAEMEDVRAAEAHLDGLKKLIDTNQAILTSIQTRAGLLKMEMALIR